MPKRLTLYILFGAAFLPGYFLSDPRTAYSIENPISRYDGHNGIISHEIAPLQNRVKRQAPISLPPPPSPSNKSLNESNVTQGLGTVWANKTRDLIPNQGQSTQKSPVQNGQGEGGNLLKQTPVNSFLPNNSTDQNSTTTPFPLGEEDPAIFNTTTGDLLFPPVNYTQYATNHSFVEKTDNFLYYDAEYKPPPMGTSYWMDLVDDNRTTHDMLSNAHRRAATLKPMFDFPFYGHNITNLTIATGGFIYVGAQVHAWLAATQYVAPLMANFDSSLSPNSTVSHLSTDEFFTVEWDQLKLHDSPDVGNFTFQTTLYKNGTIVFAYKSIPIPIKNINDTQHPVKVGLSDAYIRDKNIFVIKQKTIYEYHRVDLKEKDYEILNGSAIIFRPKETCHNFKTCETCTAEIGTEFDCAWCPKLNRCSSGMDRNRQEWVLSNCEKEEVHVQHSAKCSSLAYYNTSTARSSLSHKDDDMDLHHDESGDNFPDHSQDKYKPENSQVLKTKTSESGTGAGGVIAMMFFVIIVFASVGWIAYAYFYPHTPSGQLLIRYRPTQWARFRRGEARYTAASIHM